MSSEDDVRKASKQFYAALNRMANGDGSAMAGIWSHGKKTSTMHPIGGRDIGWDAIKTSFDQVASLASKGKVELKDQMVRVVGDVAYELGVERGEITMGGHHADIDHRVTNIYEQEGGAWKLVHHHTDISPPMLDILARLQAAAE